MISCSSAKTQILSLGIGVCLTGLCCHLVPILERLQGSIVKTLSTYHLQGKIRNFSSKIKWLAYSVLEASENMGCDLRRCNYLRFSVCSADFDIRCSGLFSHLVKFCSFTFTLMISTRVVCVNGRHSRFYPLLELWGFCGFEVSYPFLRTWFPPGWFV